MEFYGEAGTWTPEDLFVASLEICTMTSFLALAQRHHLPIEEYESHAEGTLESFEGAYRFTRVTLRPRIVIADGSAVRQTARASRRTQRLPDFELGPVRSHRGAGDRDLRN
ncbi:MAG: OsmC family protein [Thermoanaerobaculia bacterium]